MRFESWLSPFVSRSRTLGRRNQRRHVGCPLAAQIEALEHKSLLTVNVLSDSLTLMHSTPTVESTATTMCVYSSMDGTPFSVAITANPTRGFVVDNLNGTFTYTSFVSQSGPDAFTFSVTEAGESPQFGTVTVDVTNTIMGTDREIFVPIASTAMITIPVSDLGIDLDGDELTVVSVDCQGDGSVSFDNHNVYYYPPTDPSNGETEAKQELFVKLKCRIQDACGAQVDAFVQNTVEDTFSGYRTYSRGNDDPDEDIYETSTIDVTVSATHSSNQIKVDYKAIASTGKKILIPGVDMYEGEYFAANHMLRIFASAGTPNTPVLVGNPSAELSYSPAASPDLGIGGSLSASLVVATFPVGATSASGTAVIQMVIIGENGDVSYGPVRQTINWSVAIRNTGTAERFTLSFSVAEVVLGTEWFPPGVKPRLDTPLRKGQHDLYLTDQAKGTMQTPFPKWANRLERDNSVGGDNKSPANPPVDWDSLIPNDGLPRGVAP